MRLVICCALLILVPTTFASEREARDAVTGKVEGLFRAKKFAALEDLAKTYRETRERTPAGMLKLQLFYNGTAGVLPDSPDSDDWGPMVRRTARVAGAVRGVPDPLCGCGQGA